jgi:hypothetical protein
MDFQDVACIFRLRLSGTVHIVLYPVGTQGPWTATTGAWDITRTAPAITCSKHGRGLTFPWGRLSSKQAGNFQFRAGQNGSRHPGSRTHCANCSDGISFARSEGAVSPRLYALRGRHQGVLPTSRRMSSRMSISEMDGSYALARLRDSVTWSDMSTASTTSCALAPAFPPRCSSMPSPESL